MGITLQPGSLNEELKLKDDQGRMATIQAVVIMDPATGLLVAPGGGGGGGGGGTSNTTEVTQLRVAVATEAATAKLPALVGGKTPVTDPTALPLPNGASTEATLVQVRDAIKAQLDIASTIWTDNSGTYYVRRDLVNEGTGVITVAFTDPTGSVAVPGAGLRPLASTDRDVTQDLFDATAGGAGYSGGDVLARVLIIDANGANPVVAAIWVNLSTGATIAAPTGGTIERANESIGARQLGAWTTGRTWALTGADQVTVAASALPTGAATESGNLATLAARTPALGAAAVAASSPVSLPSDQVVGAAASIAALNTDLLTGVVSGWYDAANFHSVCIQLIGGAGITAGQVFFECTNDTAVAAAGNVWPVDELTSLTPTPNVAALAIAANTVRMFGGAVTARYVRVRVSTAFLVGTVQAVAVFSQLPYVRQVMTVHQPAAANLNVNATLASTTVTSISAGTNLTNDVGLQARANATGALTIAKVLALASTNATLVKAGAGRVTGWRLYNTSATIKFVKFFNKVTAPVPGTDTPVFTIALAPNSESEVSQPVGIGFATGIGYSITAAVADTDATAVAANDVVGMLLFA